MNQAELLEELKLAQKVLALTRFTVSDSPETLPKGCTLSSFNRVFNGETVVITADNGGCYGGQTGFGLTDEIPNTPGGFGYFLSYGKGNGYPAGERVKKSPELAEQFMLNQPKSIMNGHNAIKIEPYATAENPDLVSFLVTPDQLSALVHLFNYEKLDYDNIIAPMTSGCASIARIPFSELSKGKNARAVIGNIDVFSRPHFPANSFFFTIPHTSFQDMVHKSDESLLASPIWKAVRKRIHSSE